jgi:hypothetical protein
MSRESLPVPRATFSFAPKEPLPNRAAAQTAKSFRSALPLVRIMSVVPRQPQNSRVAALSAQQQKALRLKRQSAPMANFMHQYASNGLGVSAMDKENANASTPSKTKSIIKKSDSEACVLKSVSLERSGLSRCIFSFFFFAFVGREFFFLADGLLHEFSKKQKAAKKRRVSFSSQLENVRFFMKENNIAGSPAKAKAAQGTPAKSKPDISTTNTSMDASIGDHDMAEDDFEREKDLLSMPPLGSFFLFCFVFCAFAPKFLRRPARQFLPRHSLLRHQRIHFLICDSFNSHTCILGLETFFVYDYLFLVIFRRASPTTTCSRYHIRSIQLDGRCACSRRGRSREARLTPFKR